MIIRVHSLGSLWQTKDLPNGGTRVWNTTGIRDGCRVRSCATLFGQLVFGPKAKLLQRGIFASPTWDIGVQICGSVSEPF